MGAPALTDINIAEPDFEVLELLGQGAFSLVHRVKWQGRFYALKRPKTTVQVDARAVALSYWREAALLARMDHPGLVKIFDTGEFEGKPYILMELLDGVPLSRVLEDGPLIEEQLVQWGITLADALASVHRFNLVHRDIKPKNIIVTPGRSCKLIDFGFASRSDGGQEEAGTAGTFLYSAPEQSGAIHRAVDQRSDLYSLGVLLYQCAAGRAPFDSPDVGTLIHLHATQAPPPLAAQGRAITPALCSIIHKLLAKDPDDRYQCAESLAMDLRNLVAINALRDDEREQALDRYIRSEDETALFGRVQEVDALRSQWAQVTAGTGALALISGEAGSGKSRLVREIVRFASDEKATVLKSKCVLNGNAPLAPIRQAVDTFLRELDRLPATHRDPIYKKLDEIPRAQARFLANLSSRLGSRASFSGLDATLVAPNQEVYFAAILGLLKALVSPITGSLLLVIDDVQWLDTATEQLLARMHAEFDRLPFLILCTARNDSESRSRVKTLMPSVQQSLELKPLADSAIASIACSLLGMSASQAKSIDPNLMQSLITRSGGSPLAAGEFLRAMFDAGVLRPSHGQWKLDHAGLERLKLPSDVLQLVVKRASELSPLAHQVLSCAALLGTQFRVDILARVSGKNAAEVDSAIQEATRAHLVEFESNQDCVFIHDRVQEAFILGWSPEDAQAVCQKYAMTLEAMSVGDRPDNCEYLMATNYSRGLRAQTPEKVFKWNLIAGRKAVESSASEDGYKYLRVARQFAQHAQEGQLTELSELEATASERTGRLAEAIEHLESLLSATQGKLNRARIRSRLSRIHLAHLHSPLALKEVREGFRELGRRPPSLQPLSVIGAVFDYVSGAFFNRLGFGFGSSKGSKREVSQVVADLYENAAMANFFEFNIPTAILTWFRPWRITYFLGATKELVFFYSSYGVIASLLKFKGAGMRALTRATALATQMGEEQMLAHCEAYEGLLFSFYGDEQLAHRQITQVLRKKGPTLLVEDLVNIGGCLIWSLVLRGYGREMLEWSSLISGIIDQRAGNTGQNRNEFITWHYTFGMLAHAQLGNKPEALASLKNFEKNIPSVPYHRAIHYGNLIGFYLEQGELGAPLECAVEAFCGLDGLNPAFAPNYVKQFYLYLAHARFQQFKRAPLDGAAQARKKLKAALRNLMIAALIPNLRAHYLIVSAALAAHDGRFRRAEKLLLRAEALAHTVDSPLAHYEIAQVRSEIFKSRGNEAAAVTQLNYALGLATAHGWSIRAKHLQEILSIDSVRSTTMASTATHERTDASQSLLQRQSDALLQLSLASSGVLDPAKQFPVVLDEIVKLLGAERAFLFLCPENSDETLTLSCGRGVRGETLTALTGYSSTVVERVRVTREPVIVSGTDDGEVSSSQSIVAHNLRSIIATPLRVRDRLIGVVYLDSTVVRGIFSQEDVKILNALASHIAITIQTTRAAKAETDRQTLQKDLEVTRAVQNLLLPQVDHFENASVSIAGFYEPASQSGGDWWWYEQRPDGSTWVIAGDVTGHGAGSAMITAAFASSFHALLSLKQEMEIPEFLESLNKNLRTISRESYSITLLLLRISADGSRLEGWSAGAPSALLATDPGSIEPMSCPGTPMGYEDLKAGYFTHEITQKTRLLIYTDGATELEDSKGRQLGQRRLAKIFAKTLDQSVVNQRVSLMEEIKSATDHTELRDDITVIAVEVRPRR